LSNIDKYTFASKMIESFIDCITVEELEAIIEIKKGKPKEISEEEKIREHYMQIILKRGLLFPPKN